MHPVVHRAQQPARDAAADRAAGQTQRPQLVARDERVLLRRDPRDEPIGMQS